MAAKAVQDALTRAKEIGSVWEVSEEYRVVQESVVPGVYEHFKSSAEHLKQYVVFGVSFDVATEAFSVVYTALYGNNFGALLTRALLDEKEGFLVPVNRPDYAGPRFVLVREAGVEELATLLKHI